MSDQLAFGRAFERLMSEIEGDIDTLWCHSHVLIEYARRGDYQGRYAMAGMVPEHCWRWPAYEEQIVQPERQARQWEKSVIDDESPASLLTRIKLEELRHIANGRAKGKSKGELVERLMQVVHPEEIAELVSVTRMRLLSDIAEWRPRYEDRCAWFLRRLASYGFSAGTKENLKRSVTSGANIKAKFLPAPRERTLPECWELIGKVLPVDAPELDYLGPCWKLDCACVWSPAASGFEGAPFKSMTGKPDGTPWTNQELRAQAREFAAKHGLSTGKGLPPSLPAGMIYRRIK